MDTEISINVDGEEIKPARPSTSVNVYGSPVARRGQRNRDESIETTSVAVAVPLANVNRVVSSIVRLVENFFVNHHFNILQPFYPISELYL